MTGVPGGLHGAFQVAWVLAMAAPVGARISELARHPTSAGAVAVVALSAVWALVAGLAWGVRVAALTTGGRFGRAARARTRRRGRRRAPP